MKSTLREHFFYWLLPTLVVLAMILMFFSEVAILKSLVAPDIGREFGLLENLQAFLLLIAVGLCLRGVSHARVRIERTGFLIMMLAFAFLLGEEINYGEHYWKLLTGQSLEPVGRGMEFNLHNKISTSPIKSVANLVILLGFVLLPLFVRPSAPAWLRFLTPPRILIVTVLCSVALSQLAHYLDDISGDADHVLGSNIAEFREAFIYYIGLMYAYTLVYKRRWPGWRGELVNAGDGEVPAYKPGDPE